MSRKIAARRRRLYLEQDGLCFYCEKPMTFRGRRRHECQTDITIDHLKPLSKGGLYGYANEVAACFRCNNRRGARCWQTFKYIVEAGCRDVRHDH